MSGLGIVLLSDCANRCRFFAPAALAALAEMHFSLLLSSMVEYIRVRRWVANKSGDEWQTRPIKKKKKNLCEAKHIIKEAWRFLAQYYIAKALPMLSARHRIFKRHNYWLHAPFCI